MISRKTRLDVVPSYGTLNLKPEKVRYLKPPKIR